MQKPAAYFIFALSLFCGSCQEPASKSEASGEKAPASQMDSDLKLVDDYLTKWDQFAQGDNELVPYIRNNKDSFEGALAGLLVANDKRASARLVFYSVVQVGGFIVLESELGKASARLLGSDFPVSTPEEGVRAYFAGDLYFWWRKNLEKYVSFPLFDEWSQRDFAQTVVIPMYKAATKAK
jgi:hypothetical protein